MRLKFVSLNLWLGGLLFDNILAFLRKQQPDIIALQEAYNGHDLKWEQRFRSVDVLSKELDYPYHCFSPAFLDRRYEVVVDSGNAILSRLPILAEETTFFDVPYQEVIRDDRASFPHVPRNMQHAVIDAHGSELNVFNIQGIWGSDGEDTPRRLAMSEKIIQEVTNKPHAMLAGDFNVDEKSQSIGNIEKYLTNISKSDRISSFNMAHKTDPGYAGAIVDMIFVSSDFKVLRHEMSDADVSDHKALVCELEIA